MFGICGVTRWRRRCHIAVLFWHVCCRFAMPCCRRMVALLVSISVIAQCQFLTLPLLILLGVLAAAFLQSKNRCREAARPRGVEPPHGAQRGRVRPRRGVHAFAVKKLGRALRALNRGGCAAGLLLAESSAASRRPAGCVFRRGRWPLLRQLPAALRRAFRDLAHGQFARIGFPGGRLRLPWLPALRAFRLRQPICQVFSGHFARNVLLYRRSS